MSERREKVLFGYSINQVHPLLKSIYQKVEFCVRLEDGTISDSIETKTGVLTGDVLSPLLFNLFTSDLAGFLRGASSPFFPCLNNEELVMLAFADDIAIISTSPSGLQRQLDRLETYCRENCLKVNTEKTKTMIFRQGRNAKHMRNWSYGGKMLENVNSFKYLGLNFSHNNKPEKHLETIETKGRLAANTVGKFIQGKKSFPLKLSLVLGKAMVQSVLAYGIEIRAWDNHEIGNKIMRMFYKKCTGLPQSAPGAGIELVLGCRSFETVGYYRGIGFLRKLVGAKDGSLLKDAYIEQTRQLGLGRDCWLKSAKKKLEGIGLGYLWNEERRGPREEKMLMKLAKQRLFDINFQTQLGAAERLKSLQHLKLITILPDGVAEIRKMEIFSEKRELTKIFLNCPGSMIRRERDLIFCTECSAPVWDRNIFLHRYLICDATDPIMINKYYKMIPQELPTVVKHVKLIKAWTAIHCKKKQ